MKFIASAIFCFIVLFSFAQESEIVISEVNIQQLAAKLYQLKLKRQSKEASIFSDATFLEKQQIQKQINKLNQENVSKEQGALISSEINDLRSEIKQLKELLAREKKLEKEASSYSENAIILKKTISQEGEKALPKDNEILVELEQISSALRTLEQKDVRKSGRMLPQEERAVVSVPYSQFQTVVPVFTSQATKDTISKNEIVTANDSLALLNKATASRKLREQEDALAKITTQLYLLHDKIDKLCANLDSKSAIQIIEIEKNIDSKKEIKQEDEAYKVRLVAYENYLLQLFFANNSFEINETYTQEIQALNKTLTNEAKIDVLIDGFASNRGDAMYNEELSMKRAIALKRKLMGLGIQPSRILTDYKGIDNKANNEAEARRLDIRYLIR